MVRQPSTLRFTHPISIATKAGPLALVWLVAMLSAPAAVLAEELVDASSLPRLQGASVAPARSAGETFNYSAPGGMAEVAAATQTLLARDGWKQYSAPLEETSTLLSFKKGPQGLSVFFTMDGGRADRSSVNYVPNRLRVDLPFPDGATDIVYDENRPYLNCNAPGTVEAVREFFDKELETLGWSRLSVDDIAARWPGATLAPPSASGGLAYYGRDKQLPVMLALERRADDRINVEIKVAPFSQPQVLEVGNDMGDMPIPKTIKSAGSSGTAARREVYAHVPAEVSTVLAFYRRELAARQWKEETRGAVVKDNDVTLAFSSPTQGTALMKLSHRYDLTIVNFTVEASAAMLAAKAKADREENDSFLKQALEMARTPTARQPNAPRSSSATASLGALAANPAPIPLPETAEDIEFDADDGKLEFTSPSNVSTLVAFFRAAMKPLGWREQPSVINNNNMVVLDYSKAGKKITLTAMQMGDTANVTVVGTGLMGGPSRPDTASKGDAAAGAAQKVEVSLEPEDGAALPVPKQRTLSAPSTVQTKGDDTPFRRELEASVPAEIGTVLAFYRRELAKLDWKELPQGAVTRPDKVVLAFSSPQGPAMLKLGRSKGETSINLVQKIPAEASKAGVMPPPGKAKLFFGNLGDTEVSITINKKTIKIAPGTGGSASPSGPTLELPPGKYRYTLKAPGKPAQNDQVEVAADDTWGLMAGPGGVLALQLY